MDIIKKDVPLKPLCSFKTGGCARYYLAPHSIKEILAALKWADGKHIKVFVLGNGTNSVFSDSGYDGLVIHMGKERIPSRWIEPEVTAGAGTKLNSLVKQSVEHGFAGMHKLAGIPGTVGGAVYMNAGAFGQEICQVIGKVVSCDYMGKTIERGASECGFGYRTSIFKEKQEIILEVSIGLTPADRDLVKKESSDISARRKEKHPLEFPNAGSMFKRPPDNYAGKLIEQAGLKGKTRNRARVSEKHANFIVNLGGCTSQDIYDLSSEVIELVRKHSGTTLEREVQFIGDFLPWPR